MTARRRGTAAALLTPPTTPGLDHCAARQPKRQRSKRCCAGDRGGANALIAVAALGHGEGLHTVVDIELSEHLGDVAFDGFDVEPEVSGDFPVGHALCQPIKNLLFRWVSFSKGLSSRGLNRGPPRVSTSKREASSGVRNGRPPWIVCKASISSAPLTPLRM